MHSWKFWFLVVSSLLAATSAQAGGKDTQRQRAARKACLAGDYAKGVSILSDLFLDTRDTTYIYNQGRCLEQNGRFEDAVFRFQEYLRVTTDLSEADEVEARKHIADCQDQLAKRNGPPAPDAPSPVPVPFCTSRIRRGSPRPGAPLPATMPRSARRWARNPFS